MDGETERDTPKMTTSAARMAEQPAAGTKVSGAAFGRPRGAWPRVQILLNRLRRDTEAIGRLLPVGKGLRPSRGVVTERHQPRGDLVERPDDRRKDPQHRHWHALAPAGGGRRAGAG